MRYTVNTWTCMYCKLFVSKGEVYDNDNSHFDTETNYKMLQDFKENEHEFFKLAWFHSFW